MTSLPSRGTFDGAEAVAIPAGTLPVGRIGPNAITRVAQALDASAGRGVTALVFAAADVTHHLDTPPTAMVNEAEVARLHGALFSVLPEAQAREVAREAGRLTGDYLLSHRIPMPAQRVLTLLPARLAAQALTKAITRHAWTFAGSGRFEVSGGKPLVLTITGCAASREIHTAEPACDYFVATFERIFRALVHRDARVWETECEASGGRFCRFEVDW
jgi:divinyl protochlorophyllide a 8-vinyl-reductase